MPPISAVTVRLARRLLDAELIANRVVHDHQALGLAYDDGAECRQPANLVGEPSRGAEVEVHPILGGLRLRYVDEPQVGPPQPGGSK